MFSRVFASKHTRQALWSGAGIAGAGMIFNAINPQTSEQATACDSPSNTTTSSSSGMTIVGMLQEISQKVSNIESLLGATNAGTKSGGFTTTIPQDNSAAGADRGIDIVLGAQWGDEGKGKLVDVLSQNYDVCARVAGGSNAGHTIVVDGVKYKFHLLPSGILNPNAVCVVGNGVVVHLPAFLNELDSLTASGIDSTGRVFLSDRAHIVFDFHQDVDGKHEERLGRHKLGTTKKGIGPAYASKIQRNGLRVGDLEDFDYFERRFRELCDHHVRSYPGLAIDVEEQLAYYKSIAPRVKEITIDTIALTNQQFDNGKKILVEGANAAMLDIDFGTYPFVTSSNPSVGSVLTGLGVSPRKLRGIYGTVKAYCTRVGQGPFPTELSIAKKGDAGMHLAQVGAEYGTTTGRARRCGWLDIPQLQFSTMINGYTAVNLTKIDVLTGLEEVKIGKGYKYKGKYLSSMPASLEVLGQVEVEYETLPGWTEDISQCRSFEDLPLNCQRYILRVQELIGVPIRWIGVGPNRLDLIDRGVGWDLSAE